MASEIDSPPETDSHGNRQPLRPTVPETDNSGTDNSGNRQLRKPTTSEPTTPETDNSGTDNSGTDNH